MSTQMWDRAALDRYRKRAYPSQDEPEPYCASCKQRCGVKVYHEYDGVHVESTCCQERVVTEDDLRTEGDIEDRERED